MRDANDIVNTVKGIAVAAVEASQPSDFCFGKVTSTNPLKIQVDGKMTLGSMQLVLTRNVTDYKIKIEIELDGVVQEKEITIYNALQIDDVVVLIKKKGGQKYLVTDKVVN